MKFDKLIKKSYTLLEADQNQQPQEPTQTEQPPSASSSSDIDKAGKDMSRNVELAEDALVKISKRLVDCFKQLSILNDVSKSNRFIDDLEKALSAGKGNVALQALEDICDKYFPEAEPQEQ